MIVEPVDGAGAAGLAAGGLHLTTTERLQEARIVCTEDTDAERWESMVWDISMLQKQKVRRMTGSKMDRAK